MNRAEYHAYLLSPEWRKIRDQALAAAGHRCRVCNNPRDLQVHHRTYERVGEECLDDLTVLCLDCHDLYHAGGRVPGIYVEDEAAT